MRTKVSTGINSTLWFYASCLNSNGKRPPILVHLLFYLSRRHTHLARNSNKTNMLFSSIGLFLVACWQPCRSKTQILYLCIQSVCSNKMFIYKRIKTKNQNPRLATLREAQLLVWTLLKQTFLFAESQSPLTPRLHIVPLRWACSFAVCESILMRQYLTWYFCGLYEVQGPRMERAHAKLRKWDTSFQQANHHCDKKLNVLLLNQGV